MNCPKCTIGKLEEKIVRGLKVKDEINSLTVDQCFACGGVWFDADELDQAIKQWVIDDLEQSFSIISSDQKERKEFDDRSIKCPRCAGKTLFKKKMHKTVVDVCGTCKGIWLDGDELSKFDSGDEAMQEALEEGVNDPKFVVRFAAKLLLLFRKRPN